MKRYGYIYDNICSLDNITLAHKKARRGKSNYEEVKMINNNPSMLKIISDNLSNNTYTTSQYSIKNIVDRGKERTIFKLPYYPDRIAQWAIMLQLEDIFLKTFIHDTYASLPNRGIHSAMRKVNKTIQCGGEYCLKFDVKKFFPSIDQHILIKLLERKIKDNRVIELLSEIISSIPFGIPIGNYISQWLANYYLSFFDHAVCQKFQLPYFRYMDDIVIFSQSKEKLFNCLDFCKRRLEELLLEMKQNFQIFPSKIRGVDFLGYRAFGDYVLVRKRIAKNIKNLWHTISNYSHIKSEHISAMVSYRGWLEYANSFRFTNKYMLLRSDI